MCGCAKSAHTDTRENRPETKTAAGRRKKKSEKFREPDSKQVDKLLQVLLFVLPKLGKEPVGQNNSERHTIYTPTQRKGKITTKPVLKGLPYWFTLIWLHSSPVSIKFGCVKKRR